MSEARRIDRRTLFDAFRRSPKTPNASKEGPPRTSTFSLAGFYDHRTQDGNATTQIPRFTLREALPAVETVPAYADPIGPNTKRPT